MRKIVDRIGMKYGMLTILELVPTDKGKPTKYLCRCDCGNEKVLKYGNIYTCKSSCGCLLTKYQKERYLNKRGSVDACITDILTTYKFNAISRGYVFNLSREQFESLLYEECYYCGVVGYNRRISKAGIELRYNGIDRIDNSKGYIMDNVVTCCKRCNRAKDTMSQKRIYKFSENDCRKT